MKNALFVLLVFLLTPVNLVRAVPILPLHFSPASLQFGNIPGGDSSPSVSVFLNLQDSGTSFGPIKLQLSDPHHFEVVSDTCSGVLLSGSASCQVDVRFHPGIFGHYSSFLVVLDEQGALGNFIPLEGTGTEEGFLAPPSPFVGQTQVSLSGTVLDFGKGSPGIASEAQSVTLINTGDIDLLVQATTFGGDAPYNFARIDACAPKLVPPTGNCTITAFFTPISNDPAQATLALSLNAPESPVLIELTGNGAAPGPTAAGGGCSLQATGRPSPVFLIAIFGYSALVLIRRRRLK